MTHRTSKLTANDKVRVPRRRESAPIVINDGSGPIQTVETVRTGLISRIGFIFKRLRQSVMVILRFNSLDTNPPPDNDKLLSDLPENEDVIRDKIRWVARLFRASNTEDGRNSAHLGVASLLESVADSDLNSESIISLNTKELRTVLDGLQERLSLTPGSEDAGARIQILEVLYWFSLRTGGCPQQLSIDCHIDCKGKKDYGCGGMNDILKGTHEGKVIALKHPRAIGMVQPSRRNVLERTFYRYSLVAFNMHNDHVIPLLGVLDDATVGGFCMVLPWMENGDLRSYQDRLISLDKLSGRHFIETVNGWLLDIADGISYLHAFGVVHGDIRGHNILVDGLGNIRLTAFGSTVIVAADDFTHRGSGSSFAWTAPELIDPQRYNLKSASPTRATDTYAFACTCVELYTGRSPFHGFSDAQVLNRVLQGQRPQRPDTDSVVLSESLWRFVTSCWDATPSRRPPVSDINSVLR